MNRLFIELYVDEDVSVLVADLLKGRGFNVTTTRAENQLGNEDDEQLAYAIEQQMAILTHNREDFEELAEKYIVSGQRHFGIIIAERHPPYGLVRRLLRILNLVTADEMENQVRYI